MEEVQDANNTAQMRSEPLKPVSVFVVMPFGSRKEYAGENRESNHVFNEIIKPAVERALPKSEYDVKINREVDKAVSGSITDSIVRNVAEADVVIADITGWNANVFLELGIRYALRSNITILITQNAKDTPFDIRDYRLVEYDPYDCATARKRISDFICQGLVQRDKCDSVVFDVFKNMSVNIPGVLLSKGCEALETRDTMTWEEYTNRVTYVVSLLKPPMTEGKFAPDALVGISNGGLIVADLIGREVFQSKPILGLWANRRTRESENTFWFFDNPYNAALCQTLKEQATKARTKEPICLVLVDDHFGTGTTARHAIGYLKQQLGDATRIVYFPLVSARVDYLQVVDDVMPYNFEGEAGKKTVFNTSKEDFIRHLNTGASYFPYLQKEIAHNN